jgi:hypothetical protein
MSPVRGPRLGRAGPRARPPLDSQQLEGGRRGGGSVRSAPWRPGVYRGCCSLGDATHPAAVAMGSPSLLATSVRLWPQRSHSKVRLSIPVNGSGLIRLGTRKRCPLSLWVAWDA